MDAEALAFTYHINAASSLHWAAWDDEYVVFDEASGQTHQVDPFRAFVLNTLAEAPRKFDDLLGEMNDALTLADTVQTVASLQAVLNEFQRLGLVETTIQ